MSYNFSVAVGVFVDDEVFPTPFLSFTVFFFTEINNFPYYGFVVRYFYYDRTILNAKRRKRLHDFEMSLSDHQFSITGSALPKRTSRLY